MINFAGHLRLEASRAENGRTVLSGQSFRAPFHLSKPYWDHDTRTLLLQVVNPTAGILAGDRLESQIGAGPGASLLVTTPSASRVFMMADGVAECSQRFCVAGDGWLEVMPEPLVPHRGSRYRQTTTIDVETGGGLFFVDQLMPGRIAFGDAWAWTELRLDLTIRLGGELVGRECVAHSADALKATAAFFGSGPMACFANAVLISGDPTAAAGWLHAVNALHRDGTWVGVSALRKRGWIIKVVAPDPLRMRDTLTALRSTLADHFPRLATSTRKL